MRGVGNEAVEDLDALEDVGLAEERCGGVTRRRVDSEDRREATGERAERRASRNAADIKEEDENKSDGVRISE